MSQYECWGVFLSLPRGTFLHHLLLINSNLPSFSSLSSSPFSSCCSNDLIFLSASSSRSLKLHKKEKLVDAGLLKLLIKWLMSPIDAISSAGIVRIWKLHRMSPEEVERGRVDLYQMSRHYDNLWWNIDWNCFSRLLALIWWWLVCFSFVFSSVFSPIDDNSFCKLFSPSSSPGREFHTRLFAITLLLRRWHYRLMGEGSLRRWIWTIDNWGL